MLLGLEPEWLEEQEPLGRARVPPEGQQALGLAQRKPERPELVLLPEQVWRRGPLELAQPQGRQLASTEWVSQERPDRWLLAFLPEVR